MDSNKISAFRTRNIPAYLAVMCTAAILIAVIYIVSRNLSVAENPNSLLFTIAISVIGGMLIMFGASMLNLYKMKKSFEKIARGESNVKIPEVWCPVLTSASEAVENLMKNKNKLIDQK